jgi:hypothetical protein
MNHPGPRSVKGSTRAHDPVVANDRREYDSLFASNVVLSRRPDTQRSSSGEAHARPSRTSATTGDGLPTMPSLDEVTDAVVRATTRHTAPIASPPPTATSPAVSREPAEISTPAVPRAAATPPIRSTDALHRIVEGTVIDTVLTNRLEGSAAARCPACTIRREFAALPTADSPRPSFRRAFEPSHPYWAAPDVSVWSATSTADGATGGATAPRCRVARRSRRCATPAILWQGQSKRAGPSYGAVGA